MIAPVARYNIRRSPINSVLYKIECICLLTKTYALLKGNEVVRENEKSVRSSTCRQVVEEDTAYDYQVSICYPKSVSNTRSLTAGSAMTLLPQSLVEFLWFRT